MKLKIKFLHAAAILCCALALITGCKKKEGGAASAGEAKITGSPSDPPVAIVAKWTAGQRYIMRMESAQTMQLPNIFGGRGPGAGGTNNPPVENNFAQEYALTVTNAADNNRGLEMEILTIELQAGRGDQQQINYDSQNKVTRDAGPMTDAFDKMIGGKIYFLVSPESKVLKVEGIKELFDRIDSPADPANANTGARGAGRGGSAILRGVYNEDLFKQLIEMAGAPPNAVHVVESWDYSRDVTAPMVGAMTVAVTNTLRGWQEHDKRKCARVEFTGSITSSGNGGASPLGIRLAIDDGKVSGRYWYAPYIGMALETIIDQNYTMTMSGMAGRNA